jgi:hypothetical protein
MKKALLLLATLLALPLVSHAGVSLNVNVPGVSLQIGDRDDRGYYWGGDRWREPRWWHARYPRGYYYAPPPRGGYYGPPPRHWHGRKYYRMPPPPPGYYHQRGPRW